MDSETRPSAISRLKRVGLALVGLLLLLVVLLAAVIILDGQFGRKTSDFANLSYVDESGRELLGYLALPEESGSEPLPAVLLIHEWWGLNEGITVLADALADEGYAVFAPDAYRGRVATLLPGALWLRTMTPQEEIRADLDSALAYLRDLEAVDPERVASMGFCFGGGQSLQLGLRQSENLALTVMYYGAVVTDPELLRPLTDGQPVLGIFAEEDQRVFVGDVIEFEAALNSLDIENQITIYPEVGHAFLNEENFDQPGAAGDAWQETLIFLDDNLQDGN